MDSPDSAFQQKEQPVVTQVCSHMSGFGYDTAKEVADRERDACKSARPPMAGLMAAFAQLATIEKQYVSLTFLTPKRFLMKDTSLIASYGHVLADLRKVEEWRSSSTTREMAGQLIFFVNARIALLDYYEVISATAAAAITSETEDSDCSTFFLPLDDIMVPRLNGIVKKYSSCLRHPHLQPLNIGFNWELGALSGLVNALYHMNHWRFFESLIQLEQSRKSLEEWLSALRNHREPMKTAKMGLSLAWLRHGSSSASNNTSPTVHQEPPLYQWLCKLRAAVSAKFSFYFHDVLLEQTTAIDMKEKCARLSMDFPAKLQAFHKRYDAHSVVLMFDATNEISYRGPGYHHPALDKEPVRGIDVYPAAFAYPSQPKGHWPSVVMILAEYAAELDKPQKVVFFYDKRAESSFYMVKIDPHMVLAVIFESKRAEKDTPINNFLLEVASQLRCCKVFASLKPGYK